MEFITQFAFIALGQAGYVKRDASVDIGQVYERPERRGGGEHAVTLDSTQNGPVTFTVDLYGAKVPFTLRVTIDDGVTPVDTDYDMGPGNTSQSINVPGGSACTALRAVRLF